MDKILESVMNNDVLSDDTKKELAEGIKTMVSEAVENARAETEIKVRAELTEKFIESKDALVEALDTKIEESLNEELEELKEDISRFRDLEEEKESQIREMKIEYADKVVQEKKRLGEQVKKDICTLVTELDAFLEDRIAAEFSELKEDMDEVLKEDFGRQIFETFQNSFKMNFVNENGLKEEREAELRQLENLRNEKRKLEENYDELRHVSKIATLTSTLSGRAKQVMEALLENVEYEELDEAYESFIDKVLNGDRSKIVENKQKENRVLAENSTNFKGGKKTVEISGDTPDVVPQLLEGLENANNDSLNRLRKLVTA